MDKDKSRHLDTYKLLGKTLLLEHPAPEIISDALKEPKKSPALLLS